MPEPRTEAELKAHYAAVQARLWGKPARAIVPMDRVRPEIVSALTRNMDEKYRWRMARRRDHIDRIRRYQISGRVMESVIAGPKERTSLSTRQASELAKILAGIGADFDASPAEILSASRALRITKARQHAMLRVKQAFPSWSTVKIGRVFDRDHTTVIHALRRAGGP